MAISSSCSVRDVSAETAYAAEADNQQLARIRLVLAVSALLVAIVDQAGHRLAGAVGVLLLCCYLLVSAIAYAGALRHARWARGTLMHGLDAVAGAAMAATNESDIFSLAFLFFAIVVASLRFGLDEGARITFVAVVLYCTGSLVSSDGAVPARLFLHAAVLLAFGRAIAQIGERQIQAARRQALLADLNQVANPRFGIDRTMTTALARMRTFFMADRCIALVAEEGTGRYLVRAVCAGSPPVVAPEAVGADLADAMLPEPRTHTLLYVRRWHRWLRATGLALGHAGAGRWLRRDEEPLGQLAAMLEAASFISAPLLLGRGRGRIYIIAGTRHLTRADALLLARIAAHELVAIDRIDLLDHLASDAAALERKKLALDLHDTAIQSYIGLQMGLAALRRKADPSNPLAPALDKLAAMAGDAIVELRDVAHNAPGSQAGQEPIFLAALRRQAAQAHAAYGVDVRIQAEGTIAFGDRLTAEVLQIVREGISNVCRHTAAKRASVLLRPGADSLRIEISNEHGAMAPAPFRPRSISERAAALGGSAFVREGRFNDTIVCVEIPL
jgi:signal transduction histidine kinase